MRSRWLISRRTAIKGLGVSLMLPLLEQMGWADPPKGTSYKPPVRLCYVYIPFGIHPDQFWPKTPTLSSTGELPQILEPLRPVISKVMPIQGLDLLANLDVTGAGMGGHHANEVSAWLSGRLIKQNDPENAITADQVTANAIGSSTTLPSLELAFEKAERSDKFDKGFNGAFFEHVSWRSATTPMPTEINPRAVFERLFSTRRSAPVHSGGGPDTSKFAVKSGDDAPTVSLDQSMLDLVMEGSRKLRGELGGGDQRKLDDYLESVRSLENRIQSIERQQAEQARAADAKKPYKTSPLLEVNVPAAIPATYSEHAQLMFDLVTLAFQSNTTRIASVMFGKPFGRSYPEIGIAEKHHELSHYKENPADRLPKILKINVFHAQQLAAFLKRLQGLTEGAGSMLDNSLVLYGSGMGDGQAHNHRMLPTLLCGGGGGTVRSGRVLKVNKLPIANLHLALIARMGVNATAFADSTGMLDLG
jgi:hypothetical protein